MFIVVKGSPRCCPLVRFQQKEKYTGVEVQKGGKRSIEKLTLQRLLLFMIAY